MIEFIKNSLGEKIDFTYDAGNGAMDPWLVVLGHGLTGNKDRPMLVETAQALNAIGFATLRFSFAGNGDSEGSFEEATITKEVSDLGAVLDAFADRKICYIGHSMGGAVGVLRAAQDVRIRALVSLAGMVDTRAFAEAEFGELTPGQDAMWEEAEFPLSQKFMQDLCETVGSVLPMAEKVQVPWLLVHGSEDDLVLLKDSESVQQALLERVKLAVIQGADHSFSEEGRADQIDATVSWLKEHSKC